MIAVDTNILVYAHREDSPWHSKAARCLNRLAESDSPWAIPWPCLHEFLGVVTHPRIYRPPTPLPAALAQVESWMQCPSLRIIGEMKGYWQTLKSVLVTGSITGSMVHDARIASICMHHGVKILWSADRDFSRFAQLKITNPMLAETNG